MIELKNYTAVIVERSFWDHFFTLKKDIVLWKSKDQSSFVFFGHIVNMN